MTGLVQVIVLLVDKVAPAADTDGIAAAALASVKAYAATPHDPAWSEWLSGAYTKSVRRADDKTFAKIQAAHPEAVEAVIGDDRISTARALGFAPLPMDGLPRDLSRLQVSGTQLPSAVAPRAGAQVRILLNKDLGMSTGKAAAQAAHALLSWALDAGSFLQSWLEAGNPPAVTWTDTTAVLNAANRPGAGPVIRDAGRTEIEPGSVTAVAGLDI